MSTKIITVKMKANKSIKVYFNPPVQNAQEIQLIEFHNQFDGFYLFCDILDSNYSLSNINENNPDYNYTTCLPSKLLAIFSDSKLYPKIKIQNNKEVANLTLEILNKDKKTLDFNETVYIVLKMYCF